MSRWALGIEYDGSGFHGWQKQPGAVRTVQTELEKALAAIAQKPIRLICAGRTDAGVHASGQVAHFDCSAERPERAWVGGANSLLPGDVRIRWVQQPQEGFHARFDAEARRYLYTIENGPTAPALLRQTVAWRRRPLDAEAMQAGAQCLLGEHDFSAFRGAECQFRSPVRRVERLLVRRQGTRIIIDITANAFLLHMVRIIVGALCRVGEGSREPQWVGEVLRCRDRRLNGDTAVARGLCLVEVRYPKHFDLPTPVMPVWASGEE